MKLLLYENLSPRLVFFSSEAFPDSRHVRDGGRASASDDEVWSYARDNDYAIVSKDSDFHQRSFLLERGPKVIWIQIGNSSTAQLGEVLRRHQDDILAFGQDTEGTFLAIA